MLCNGCNWKAGVLDTDPEYLEKLAAYVQRGAPEGSAILKVER